MPKKIYVEPENVWGYYLSKKGNFGEMMYEIASLKEFGISIYVAEESDYASLIVESDDSEIYSEMVINKDDCTKTAKKIYDDYLNEQTVVKKIDEKLTKEDKETLRDFIEEREDELDCAAYNFVHQILEIGDRVDDDVISDIKEHMLEYMARKHKIDIYRPMFLEDEKGEEFFEEYPYDHLIFEDEDNPIYK